ncbi:MAG: hypothetical protein ACJ748_02195 [Flavisolibacter sp.]
MKKLILLSLITVALFSCKKENQDIANNSNKPKYYFYVAEVTNSGDTTRTEIVVAQ